MSDLRSALLVSMIRDTLLCPIARDRLLEELTGGHDDPRDRKRLEEYAEDRARNIASWFLALLAETGRGQLDRQVEDVNLGRWLLGGLIGDRNGGALRLEGEELRGHQALTDEAVRVLRQIMAGHVPGLDDEEEVP